MCLFGQHSTGIMRTVSNVKILIVLQEYGSILIAIAQNYLMMQVFTMSKLKYKEVYIKKETGQHYIVFAAGEQTCVLLPYNIKKGYIHDIDKAEFWLNGLDVHREFHKVN